MDGEMNNWVSEWMHVCEYVGIKVMADIHTVYVYVYAQGTFADTIHTPQLGKITVIVLISPPHTHYNARSIVMCFRLTWACYYYALASCRILLETSFDKYVTKRYSKKKFFPRDGLRVRNTESRSALACTKLSAPSLRASKIGSGGKRFTVRRSSRYMPFAEAALDILQKKFPFLI